MVSVSSAVPKLPDGKIDIAQWSQRLVQGHARLQHEPLEEAATWLSGFGDSLLLQSLEQRSVRGLRLAQSVLLGPELLAQPMGRHGHVRLELRLLLGSALAQVQWATRRAERLDKLLERVEVAIALVLFASPIATRHVVL